MAAILVEQNEFDNLKSEIEDAHARLNKYINKEHWSLAGRIEGLIGLILRARQDKKLDEVLNKIEAEYIKQFEGWTIEEVLRYV